MNRGLLLLLALLLVGCAQPSYREYEIPVETLSLSELQREPARVVATLTGWMGACERLEVRQRLSGKTFHLTLVGIHEGSADTACPAIALEYTERVVLELSRYDLEPGVYRVKAGSLEKTFAYPGAEVREALVETVGVALLESYPVQVVVTAHGYLTSGCEELGEVTQRLEDRTFFVTIPAVSPWGESCPPVAPPFTERVRLETTDLPPGTYTVDVNGVTQDFALP